MKSSSSDTVFIIASHANDYDQINSLHNLCLKIKNYGYEYIISSHTKIPDHISNSSRACIFDQRNKKVPVENRDLSQRGIFFIESPEFLIESPFFMHGGNPCYTQAHLDNVFNCLIKPVQLITKSGLVCSKTRINRSSSITFILLIIFFCISTGKYFNPLGLRMVPQTLNDSSS